MPTFSLFASFNFLTPVNAETYYSLRKFREEGTSLILGIKKIWKDSLRGLFSREWKVSIWIISIYLFAKA